LQNQQLTLHPAMRLGLTLVLYFFIQSLFAQIQVVNRELIPIEGVQLQHQKEVIAVTDAAGKLSLDKSDLAYDTYVLFHESYYLKSVTKEALSQNTIILYERTQSFPTVVVLPKKGNRKSTDLALNVDVLQRKDIELVQPQNTADLVGSNGLVYIQKSQQGGGSPMMRGFATNRVLLVVDNVRMNNAIFRSGNLQNILSVDPFSVEESVVLFGPASQLYGSDALGGVLSLTTKDPMFSNTDKTLFFGDLDLRYSSVNNENTWHVDFNIGGEKLASYTSLTFSNFGDLKMGNNGDDFYLRNQYVAFDGLKDTILDNPNPNKQINSGYRQLNALQKLKYKLSDSSHLLYNFQLGTTSNIPRYDRLILQNDNGGFVNSEWYYGPQVWILNQLAYKSSKATQLKDKLTVSLYHQFFEESRNDRRFNNARLRTRTETVNAYGLNIDARKDVSNTFTLNYGLEAVYNTIGSEGQRFNIETLEITPTSTRYPDGSLWATGGLYVNALKSITSRYVIEGGFRYNLTHSSGTFDTSFYPFPEVNFSNTTQAITGSLSNLYKLKNGKIAFVLSTGFRAPNIDDLSKVFDSNPGLVVLPNPNLQSEYAYNAEINYNTKIKKRLNIGVSLFYTYLDNAIDKSRASFNGQDSIIYDGVLSGVEMLNNQDFATVYGTQLSAAFDITDALTLISNYTILQSGSATDLPIRHITPNFGSTVLSYAHNKYILRLSAQYNQQFNENQFSQSERNDPFLYLTDANGELYSPAWWVLNFRGVYHHNEKITINGGIENILNKRYRMYRSGIVAPGRNFTLSFSYNFQ
jgi:hemoglobin/transferrin/lactoferrin receptor protein